MIAPTQAQAATAPDERAAAQAFADAALDYTRAVRSALPAARKAADAAKIDAKQCAPVWAYLERRLDTDNPTRRELRIYVLAALQPWPGVYATVLPAQEAMLAALDATPTADAALRTGRAVWRSQVNAIRLYSSFPTDICAQLSAWFRDGAKGTPLPSMNLRGLDDPEEFDREPAGPGPEERLGRAVKRMRELGQGQRRASRFTGDEAFAPLEPLFRGILGIEGGA